MEVRRISQPRAVTFDSLKPGDTFKLQDNPSDEIFLKIFSLTDAPTNAVTLTGRRYTIDEHRSVVPVKGYFQEEG